MKMCIKQLFRFVQDCCIDKRHNASRPVIACCTCFESRKIKEDASHICLKLADRAGACGIRISGNKSAGPVTEQCRGDRGDAFSQLSSEGYHAP